MGITVSYMGQLKNALGLSSEQVDLSVPCTVPDLITALADRHGERFRRLVCTTDGRPHPSILVCVGEEQVPFDSDTQIADGAEVMVLTPISGG